jgi:hypothetical protein
VLLIVLRQERLGIGQLAGLEGLDGAEPSSGSDVL